MGVNAIAAHTRHYPNHLRSPYFSPALPSPDGSPRFSHLTQGQGKHDKGSVNGEQKKGTKVYVQAGTAELLWDQAKMLCRGMREEGVDVTLREVRRCAFVSPFLLVRDMAPRSYADIRRNYPYNVFDYRSIRALGDRLRLRDTFYRFPGIST
jgi:acetyl esterase/lipase